MIKNRAKKVIRKTVVGFALLSGIIVAGVNPASADTLKDSNGNSIVAGQKYYMEPYEYPGQGLAYDFWRVGQWAKLGSTPGQTVTIEQSGDSVRLKTDKVGGPGTIDPDGGFIPDNLPLYLGINYSNDGVELIIGTNSYYPDWWIPTENPAFTAGNYFAFKNYYSNKFMSVGDQGGWLTTNKSNMDSKTMWRLIPKQ
ncbi:hypothetical protein [Bacillus cereus]|uniref:hypothetical protein n=1 Tax=Bacillus cereus TaxID=1396 RepID=UPI000BF7A33B|nr:hypothetical protein [Bacillus cereus]PEQ68110.1 hypothetical protein CN469_04240 [Bacillus cereus]